MTAKQTLIDQLEQDNLKSVLKGLHTLGKRHRNTPILDDTIFQSSRLKALKSKRKTNIISLEDEHLETAKIRQALLQTINDLPDDWGAEEIEMVPTISKSNWKKYAAIITGAITLLAGIAEFTGYSLSDIFEKNETTKQPVITQPPSPKASTLGANSPAVITEEGDVNINYGTSAPKNDSTTKK